MVDASATNVPATPGLAARTVTIKIRFGDFTMITRSIRLAVPIDAAPAIGAVADARCSTSVEVLGRRPAAGVSA